MTMNALNGVFFRYLSPVDRKPARITRTDNDFAKNHDFKDMKFPGKTIHFTRLKKWILLALVFLFMKKKQNIQSMYQKMLWR